MSGHDEDDARKNSAPEDDDGTGGAAVSDEAVRLAALRSLEILDTATESDYDDITALAAVICGTPIAAVSLVDAERQWFKSEIGLGVRETRREDSFCAHAITAPGEIFVVPDATADDRFLDNRLVTGHPSIRFYAGAPLVTGDGVALGSLCVIDQRPRELSPEQYTALRTLARQVSRLIEQRGAARQLLAATRAQELEQARRRVAGDRFRRAFTASASGMLVIATDGSIVQCNQVFAAPLGVDAEALVGRSIFAVTAPEDHVADRELGADLLAGSAELVRRQKHFLAADGSLIPAMVTSCVIPVSPDGEREFLDQVEWLTEQRAAEAGLMETQSALDAIVSIDTRGRVVSWNDGAVRMFGRSRVDMLGRTLADIIPERLFTAHVNAVEQVRAGGPTRLVGQTLDLPARRRDGSEFPVQVSLSSWRRGGNTYHTGILRDVTAPRRAAELVALVKRAAEVANHSATLAEAVDRLLPVLASTAPATAVRRGPPTSGGVPDPPSGQPHFDAVTTERRCDGTVTLRLPVVVGQALHGSVELDGPAALAADGALLDALGQVGAHLSRVAERARTAHDLVVRSVTDPLTGLANRNRILELLSEQHRRDDPGSTVVLFLDLDRFKTVNDSAGHAAGDQVLRSVAARLSAVLRPADTLARLGGDEFVVLCTDVPEELLAESVARRLITAIDEPFSVLGNEFHLDLSAGIAAMTPGTSPEQLLRRADIAMYRAKATGTGYAVFDTAMETDLDRVTETRNALFHAVSSPQLHVHYQPVVRPTDHRILGLEGLVRWDRPGHGMIPPAEFVPLAEDSGLIGQLGFNVLDQACRQMAHWSRVEPGLDGAYVAVNVAAAQLHPGFVGQVTDVLHATGLRPGQLLLELTESALIQDINRSRETLTELRALGVRVALDDFGTGYSSLSYLRELPVDVLKIDRSFVEPLGSSPRADALVEVVLDLARVLGLAVVAEGVETAEQVDALQRRHCPALQGYYYSRPVPGAEIPAVLDRLRQAPIRQLS